MKGGGGARGGVPLRVSPSSLLAHLRSPGYLSLTRSNIMETKKWKPSLFFFFLLVLILFFVLLSRGWALS